MPTVAIASEFLDAFSRIPRAQQRKVREFTEKFRLDPTSAGINYEKIHVAKDDKVRTVRIGRDYRAIVLHPSEGDVYVLAWVDHHDEAMDWTRNRTFEINPRTGSLQIIDVHAVETAVEDKSRVTKKRKGVLAAFDDDLLLEFGVPTVLLPAVRAVQSADELQALTKHLPAEAAEALLWLAEGIPPDEVRATIAASAKTKVDTKDFRKSAGPPRLSAPVRDDQIIRRPERDAERPARQMAGLPPSQPGATRQPAVQRSSASARRRGDGKNGRSDAPCPAPGREGLH